MKEILAKLVEGKNLTKEEAMKAQELILTGQATEAQIACFLTALRMKGETLDEITDDELLEFMREQYEEKCCGDTEYLEGTFLSDFAQMVRSGK